MARETVVVCNGCKAQKREVNHWWSIVHLRINIRSSDALAVPPPVLLTFEQAEDLDPSFVVLREDFCGSSCLIQAVNTWMGEKAEERGVRP